MIIIKMEKIKSSSFYRLVLTYTNSNILFFKWWKCNENWFKQIIVFYHFSANSFHTTNNKNNNNFKIGTTDLLFHHMQYTSQKQVHTKRRVWLRENRKREAKWKNNTQRVYVARHEENSSSSLLHRAYIGGWTVKRKEVLESISTSTLRNNTTLSSTEKSSSLHVILLHMCFTATEWRKHCTHRGICRCDWR